MFPKTGAFVFIYRLFTALTGWVGLFLQLYLIIQNAVESNTGLVNEIIRFFSYFTILTNLVVAVCLTVLLFKPHSIFFSRANVQSGVAVYIVIVGIVYSLLLRQIWNPQGLQLIADRILHDVIPVLFLLYWLLFVPKGTLKSKNIFGWLVYPTVYLVYVLIRGSVSGDYPYPFIDVQALGYDGMLINALMILAGFIVMGVLVVLTDRLIQMISRKLF